MRSFSEGKDGISHLWNLRYHYHALKSVFSSLSTCLSHHHEMNQLISNQDAYLNSDMIFQNTTNGILITDLNHKIVSINRSFSHITGYNEEEALGKSPGFLKSGRHSKSFYKDLWNSLIKTGQWQGQIWNKRKNGEIFPELLTINTIKDNEGNITHHMGVFSDISSVNIQDKHMEYLAFHDPLTGLPNRLKLKERLKHDMTFVDEKQLSLAVLFIDFDGFKAVNDSYGHDFGDIILSMAANRLNNNKRNTDFLARVGGDEFILIINSLFDEKILSQIAMNIIETIKTPFHTDKGDVQLGTSVGISLYPKNTTNSDDLLKQADQAMYQAKKKGRNTYIFY